MAIFSEAQMSFIPSEFPTENAVKYANGLPIVQGQFVLHCILSVLPQLIVDSLLLSTYNKGSYC